MSDFGIAIRHHFGGAILLIFSQDLNTRTKGHQSIVDASRLTKTFAACFGSVVTFASSQVDQWQLTNCQSLFGIRALKGKIGSLSKLSPLIFIQDTNSILWCEMQFRLSVNSIIIAYSSKYIKCQLEEIQVQFIELIECYNRYWRMTITWLSSAAWTTRILKTEWLRLDSALSVVWATRRRFWPLVKSSAASFADLTSISVTAWTYLPQKKKKQKKQNSKRR